MMNWHSLVFRDLDPQEVSGQWTEELSSSLFSREQANKLSHWLNQPDWNSLCAWRCLVIVTDGGADDRRGLSVAFAIADALRIDRSAVIQHGVEKDDDVLDEDASEPPNEHIYKTTKSARYAVIA